MAAKLLTDLTIAKVRPDPQKRIEIPDRQQPGLYLVVQPSGKRSFAVRTRLAGKPIKVTIGQVGVIDLADARRRAGEALQAALRGEDPRIEGATPRITTVADAVDEFIMRYAKPRLRSWRDVDRRLRHDLVKLYGPRPLGSLTRVDLVRMLDAMADRGLRQGANRGFAHARKMLSWCTERGMIEASPAAGIKPPAKEISRDRVLEDWEIAAIWTACGSLGFPFGPLIRLMLLCAQRRGEVAGIRWCDIDGRIWTLPREQTKADREHTVPLSDLAIEMLACCPALQPWRRRDDLLDDRDDQAQRLGKGQVPAGQAVGCHRLAVPRSEAQCGQHHGPPRPSPSCRGRDPEPHARCNPGHHRRVQPLPLRRREASGPRRLGTACRPAGQTAPRPRWSSCAEPHHER